MAVLGSGCPDTFASNTGSGKADVLVLAPMRRELRSRIWRARAGEALASGSADVVVVIGGIGARVFWTREAKKRGWTRVGELWPLPRDDPHHFAPASRGALSLLLRLVGSSSRRGALAAAVLAIPGGAALLRAFAPISVMSRGTEPLFASVLEFARVTAGEVVTSLPRSTRTRAVLHITADRERPTVVKAGEPAATVAPELGEGEALATVAAGAAACGVETPSVLADGAINGIPALAETWLNGDPATIVLGRDPEQLEPILTRLAAFLQRWNAATASRSGAALASVETHLHAATRVVAPALRDGGAYAERVERLWRERAASLPFVASHNDLTMANVLVRPGSLGVVDWEFARDHALPLVDLFYAIVDAVAAADRVDHAAACTSCFHGGRRSRFAARLVADVAGALEIDEPGAELAFHACWATHAANEVERGLDDGPFLRVVRATAAWENPFRYLAA